MGALFALEADTHKLFNGNLTTDGVRLNKIKFPLLDLKDFILLLFSVTNSNITLQNGFTKKAQPIKKT